MLRFSTGLRTLLAGRAADSNGNGFSGAFYRCFIDVYTGNQPANPDDAPTGTLLGTFSADAADKANAANGLVFGPPADGAVAKSSGQVWRMLGVAAGTAGWARVRTFADAGGSSTSLPRVDMAVALTGGDLNISSVTVGVGTPHTIDTFSMTFPMQ